MKQQILSSMSATIIAIAVAGLAPAQDIANGNMPKHMDVNEMDGNHDGVITKEEYAAYGEKIWKIISRGRATVPVDTAAIDFATGNMAMNVEDMDTDHDGTISHQEFIAYGSKAFDRAKNPQGVVTLEDATTNFASGHLKP